MEELKTAQFDNRGEWKALYHHGNGTTEDPDLLAFSWVDRDLRYFISNTSNLRPGPTIDCRLHQVDKSPNAPPQHVVTYNGKPVMRDRRDQQRCCICNFADVLHLLPLH